MSNDAPLFEAIEQHDVVHLARMLSEGADPNRIDESRFGWRPLHAAIEELEYGAPIEAVLLLLRYGAAVDGWDATRTATPLLMALFRGQMEAVRMLLAAGADPNVEGVEGDSPLRWSVGQGDHDTAAMLLRCGAGTTINRAGGDMGTTALGLAASRLDERMVQLLLDAGADPRTLDNDHQTACDRMPLRATADVSAWDAVRALLER